LGPFSYVRYYDEADITISRMLYDKFHHLGGRYMHSIQGGQDSYTTNAFGGQFFSLEKILFAIFPLWITILIHKTLLVSFSTIGTYILLRKITKINRFNSFSFGAFFSVYNIYAVYSSLHHGLGFTILPVAIYVYYYLSNKNYYFIVSTLLSVLIAFSTSITHSFQSIIFGLIVCYLFIEVKNKIKILFAITILLLIVILNWIEVLYGMATIGQETSRAGIVDHSYNVIENIIGGFVFIYGKTNVCIHNCNSNNFIDFSPAIFLIFYVLIVGFFYKIKKLKTYSLIYFLTFCGPGLIYLIIYLISFVKDINFLRSVNIAEISYFIIIPSIFLASHLINDRTTLFTKTLPILFLCSALLYISTYKITNLNDVIYSNKKKINSIPNLIDKKTWEPNKMYRAVATLPYIHFHPNFLWTYGIDTLDGYTNLVQKSYVDFWHYGLHQNKYEGTEKFFKGGNFFITYFTEPSVHNNIIDFNYKKINFKNYIDINMLKLTNTGYIISYFPITGKQFKLVSGPSNQPYEKSDTPINQKDFKYYTKRFLQLTKEGFKPSKVYIYNIDDYSDRFYFPKKVFYYNTDLDIRQLYKFISSNYQQNSIYTDEKNIYPAKGNIMYAKKIEEGYEIKVSVKNEGIFVVNNFFSPYWKAYINNQPSHIINLSNVHQGLELKKGESLIILKYERKLLSELIKDFI
jgi:hypothetical protein